jgi:hypothetical protein
MAILDFQWPLVEELPRSLDSTTMAHEASGVELPTQRSGVANELQGSSSVMRRNTLLPTEILDAVEAGETWMVKHLNALARLTNNEYELAPRRWPRPCGARR